MLAKQPIYISPYHSHLPGCIPGNRLADERGPNAWTERMDRTRAALKECGLPGGY